MNLKRTISNIPIIRNIFAFGYRFYLIIDEISKKIFLSIVWLFKSKETTNYSSYDLTDINKKYLAQTIAYITKKPYSLILKYITEIEGDKKLKSHIRITTQKDSERYRSDAEVYYARKIGWCAMVRAIKPKIVVETGVDKGLGSCILISALMKNKEEGHIGYHYGTDINPKAGYLITGEYSKHSKILYGDSIESLKKFNKKIDLFISDSDHLQGYEYKEYTTIKNKLTVNAIILGNCSHWSTDLFAFSVNFGRNFLYFSEQPKNFWREGAGIGFSF